MKKLLQKIFGLDVYHAQINRHIAHRLMETRNSLLTQSRHNFIDVAEALDYIAEQLSSTGDWNAAECLNHVEEVKAEREFNQDPGR